MRSSSRWGALLGAMVLAIGVGGACATPARALAFADVASAATSRHEGGPALLVGTTDDARTTIASVRPGLALPEGVVLIAAFQGQQPTGGFGIRITRVERDGSRLLVRAIFSKPLDNAFVSDLVTSPIHIVSIAASDAADVHEAVLFDESGAERARAALG